MSYLNSAGQARALPFTGLTSLPIVVLGALLSAIGLVLTRVRPKASTKTLDA